MASGRDTFEKSMSMEEICDKCGDEVDSSDSMPDPEAGTGSLCPECYEEAASRFDLKKGAEWIRQQLPSMEQFLKIFCRHCKLQPGTARLEGNCHAAAAALVEHLQKKNLDVKIKRGHWLGEDVRPERRDHVAQQHSWVEMEVPDSSTVFYVDPTQFVFTGAEPSIGISTKDDYRYDPGGYTLRELCRGSRQMPERNGSPTHLSKLNSGARQAIVSLYGKRDWTRWTREEMHVVANTNPEKLAGYAKEIFTSIKESGNRVLIPIDARMEIIGC